MNEDKLKKVFKEALNIDESIITDELTYNTIPEWDSISHMHLIDRIEKEFDLVIDTEDVIALNSFAKAKEIIKKYGININS
ncbi:MAG: acyl carrier protein [Ignavibacteriaceae bacterium]|jgi:acyl carrier protein